MTSSTARRRVGLIGCGKIGGAVIREIVHGPSSRWNEIDGVLTRTPRSVHGIETTSDPDAFFASRHDLVIEMGGPAALLAHGARALQASEVWSISPSALVDESLWNSIHDAHAAHGHRLRLLSGATAGLDGIAKIQVTSGSLTLVVNTRAEPDGPRVAFEGSVRDAIREFPTNINIAAAAALAGPGLDATRVRVVAAGPHQERVNVIHAESSAYRLEVRTLGKAVPAGTPVPTACSIIAALRQLDSAIVVG